MKNIFQLVFGVEAQQHLSRWFRYRLKVFKGGRFSRFGIDAALEQLLPHRNGFYVELGANDGALASNSYYFELRKNWRGILIEPCPNLFLRCVKMRGKKNKVFCNACVPFDYNDRFVGMIYSDSMTISDDLELDIGDRNDFIVSGLKHLSEGETNFYFGARAATLNSLLEAGNAPALIDFLSLDVEGAELDVLRGVDFSRYNFRYLVIESRDIEKIQKFLNKYRYTLLKKLSHHDFLFKFEE